MLPPASKPKASSTASAEPPQALHEALRKPGPCLIHVSIDRKEFVYPMVPPGAANKEMIGG